MRSRRSSLVTHHHHPQKGCRGGTTNEGRCLPGGASEAQERDLRRDYYESFVLIVTLGKASYSYPYYYSTRVFRVVCLGCAPRPGAAKCTGHTTRRRIREIRIECVLNKRDPRLSTKAAATRRELLEFFVQQ